MLLGIGFTVLTLAQIGGAYALWPARPAPARPAKGLSSVTAERIKELTKAKLRLTDELALMRADRDRLVLNEAIAIQARDEVVAEKAKSEIEVETLKVRVSDLTQLAAGQRRAAVRADVERAAKKSDDDSGSEGSGSPAPTPSPGR